MNCCAACGTLQSTRPIICDDYQASQIHTKTSQGGYATHAAYAAHAAYAYAAHAAHAASSPT
jgi:hypothetical protein